MLDCSIILTGGGFSGKNSTFTWLAISQGCTFLFTKPTKLLWSKFQKNDKFDRHCCCPKGVNHIFYGPILMATADKNLFDVGHYNWRKIHQNHQTPFKKKLKLEPRATRNLKTICEVFSILSFVDGPGHFSTYRPRPAVATLSNRPSVSPQNCVWHT